MTGPTHKQYAICFAYLASMLFFKLGINNVNYYLSIPILLMASKYGAKFPDVDHTWNNVSDKTVINKIINTLIHITGGKHRSWQTHSIDICAWFTIMAYNLPLKLYMNNIISDVNREVATLLLLGFSAGWISHMFSDMLNGVGVRLFCWSKFTVAFVPHRLFRIEFKTGEEWESFCCSTTQFINRILGVICLLYPLIINGTINNIIGRLIK